MNTISIAYEDPKMNMYAIDVNNFRVQVARVLTGYNKRGAMMYQYQTVTFFAPDYNMSNRTSLSASSVKGLVKKLEKLNYRIVKAV